jgi:hypothetical protein
VATSAFGREQEMPSPTSAMGAVAATAAVASGASQSAEAAGFGAPCAGDGRPRRVAENQPMGDGRSRSVACSGSFTERASAIVGAFGLLCVYPLGTTTRFERILGLVQAAV